MEEIRIFLGTIERVKNFVNEVSHLECDHGYHPLLCYDDFDLVSGRYVIDAKSIMGIFSTDLSKPVNVRIHAQGAEAEKALQVVRKYAEE